MFLRIYGFLNCVHKSKIGIFIERMTECIEHYLRPSNCLLLNQPVKTDILIEQVDEVDNIDYRLELARLKSFKNWPCPWLKPERLAASGFYYTGEGDKVRCFECQIEICQWQADDNPMVDHQRWSGKCRFVRNIPCGNVPIGTDPNTIPEPVSKGIDVCGPYGVVYMPFSGPDNNIDEMTYNFGELSATRPKYPEFASYDARLRTYETWPRAMSQTKEALATAGFYYTGNGDQTLCYHCGGGLRDWEPEDDVWEQHAKWFDYCPYLLMVKGRDFVSRITRRTYFTPETYNASQNAEVVERLVEKVSDESPACGSSQSSIISDDTGIESPGSIASSSAGSSAGSIAGSFAGSISETPESCEGSIEGESTGKGEKPVDKDARMCKICYNRELRMLFIPCGHLLACAECAKNMKICGVCRKPVQYTVPAYIP